MATNNLGKKIPLQVKQPILKLLSQKNIELLYFPDQMKANTEEGMAYKNTTANMPA